MNKQKMQPCSLCASEKTIEVLTVRNAPIRLGFCPSATHFSEKDCQDLHIQQCTVCGFVQQADPLSPEELYTDRVGYVGGYRMTPHMLDQMSLLKSHASLNSCLEVGCCHGEALKALTQTGFSKVVGLEAQAAFVAHCQAEGMLCEKGLLTPETAAQIVSKHQQFEVVMLRHVFEHITNLYDFFQSVDILLQDKGFLFIEVPDFLSANAQLSASFSIICHEHCSYFTKETLCYCLELYGYSIVYAETEQRAGGVLNVLAQKNRVSESIRPPLPFVFTNLSSEISALRRKLHYEAEICHAAGGKVFFYGASGQGLIMLHILELDKILDGIFDDTPEKHGKYIFGYGIRISPLQELSRFSSNTQSAYNLIFVSLHPEWEITAFQKIQNIKTGKVRIIPLLSNTQTATYD